MIHAQALAPSKEEIEKQINYSKTTSNPGKMTFKEKYLEYYLDFGFKVYFV